jgi:hypothetical protein
MVPTTRTNTRSDDEPKLPEADVGSIANALSLGRPVGSAGGVAASPERGPNPAGPKVAGTFCDLFGDAVAGGVPERDTRDPATAARREAGKAPFEPCAAEGGRAAGGSGADVTGGVVGGPGVVVVGGRRGGEIASCIENAGTIGFDVVGTADAACDAGAGSGSDNAPFMAFPASPQFDTAGIVGLASTSVAAPEEGEYSDAPGGCVVASTVNGPT